MVYRLSQFACSGAARNDDFRSLPLFQLLTSGIISLSVDPERRQWGWLNFVAFWIADSLNVVSATGYSHSIPHRPFLSTGVVFALMLSDRTRG